MTAVVPRRESVALAVAALRRVFEPSVVAGIRDDTPLSSLGLADADMACLADAVHAAAREQGRTVLLGDREMDAVVLVGDLVDAISAASASSASDQAVAARP